MTEPLSHRLQATAAALGDTTLTRLADVVDVEAFTDVLEHAAALAFEAEHEAVALSNAWGLPVGHIAYPPLVVLLGRAITTEV